MIITSTDGDFAAFVPIIRIFSEWMDVLKSRPATLGLPARSPWGFVIELVGEVIDARLHNALDGSGHGVFGGCLGTAQQLFEKQRVAIGPLDTGTRELVGGIEELGGHRDGIRLAQWP